MSDHVKKQIQEILEKSLKEFPDSPQNIPSVNLEVPSEKSHGDLCCSIAMRLAGILRQDPVLIAVQLKNSFEAKIKTTPLNTKVDKIEVKKPGFLNFFLSQESLYDILYEIFHIFHDVGVKLFASLCVHIGKRVVRVKRPIWTTKLIRVTFHPAYNCIDTSGEPGDVGNVGAGNTLGHPTPIPSGVVKFDYIF